MGSEEEVETITAQEAIELSSYFWENEGANMVNEKIREAAQRGERNIRIKMDYDQSLAISLQANGFYTGYNLENEFTINW